MNEDLNPDRLCVPEYHWPGTIEAYIKAKSRLNTATSQIKVLEQKIDDRRFLLLK